MNSRLILNGAAVANHALYTQQPPVGMIQLDQVKHLLNGMMTIFTSTNHFTEINACYRDAATDIQDLTTAIADFKAKETTSILDGLMHVGNFLVNLPKSTADCLHMQEDLKRLASWAKGFLNPMTEMTIIWNNMTKNYVHIISMLDLFNQKMAEGGREDTAGRYLALMLVDVLGEVPAAASDPDSIPMTNW